MKPLRIAIIAQLESPTITEQLAPLLRDRGHTVDILNLSTVPKDHFTAHPDIQALTTYDVLYYRSGLGHNGESSRAIQLEAFLKNTAVKTVNLHYTEHPLAHSKTYETKQAEEAGLQIPTSVYEQTANFATLSQALGVPFVAKIDYGTHGNGVSLIQTAEELDAMRANHPDLPLLYQAFIAHDFEYRVHVMNGAVISIWKKAPPTGDFRSNETLGGAILTADPEYSNRLDELAKHTFAAFGFEIFVVDFMLEKNTDTFYFTEINLNPGWGQSDREAAGIDVIGLTADYFEKICT